MAGFKVPNANQGGVGPKDCVTVPCEAANVPLLSLKVSFLGWMIEKTSSYRTRFWHFLTGIGLKDSVTIEFELLYSAWNYAFEVDWLKKTSWFRTRFWYFMQAWIYDKHRPQRLCYGSIQGIKCSFTWPKSMLLRLKGLRKTYGLSFWHFITDKGSKNCVTVP